jgi:pyridoxine/pyridoxamine 5'-phosphate oxidase
MTILPAETQQRNPKPYRMPRLITDNKVIINDIPHGIEDIEKLSWRLLYHGALMSKNPMHYMGVATYGTEGINLRTVVLRHADTDNKTLRFHTDTRSQKWQDLQAESRVSLLLYDNPEKTQLRLSGIAELHCGDDLADEAWEKTALYSRKCYLAVAPPSADSELPTSGLPEAFTDMDPNEAETMPGRKNFGVIQVRVHSLDCLNLNAHGHRRAKFTYDEAGKIERSTWLVP